MTLLHGYGCITASSQRLSIDREGMGREGGEGTSAKEDNGGRERSSAAAMTVDGGAAVGSRFFLMAHAV